MSWRRKALTLGFVFGAGVLCLSPVLSDSISKRIATSWNAQASVAKVEISLPRSSLSLFDIDIRRPDLLIHGDEVHLKMNSESLWYRDSIVESLIGKGFLFQSRPSIASAPSSETAADSPVENAKNSIESLATSCKEFEAKIRSELALALKQFHDFETQSQVRTQTIDSRISRFRSELLALQDPTQTPNPLRVSQRLEQLRSEGSRIQQLLAEDRLKRKQEAKVHESTIASLQESIKTFRTTHRVPEIDTPSLIENVLYRSVNDAQQRLQPYTTLLQFSANSLFNNPSMAIQHEGVVSNRIDQDLVTGRLKPRQSRILQGQISGIMEHEGGRDPTVIRVINPPSGSIADRARIQIDWGSNTKEDASTEQSASKTHAVVERMKLDTSSVAIHLSLEQRSKDECLSLQSSWDATKTVSKIQLTSPFVERQFYTLGLIEPATNESKPADGPLIEATRSSEFPVTHSITDALMIDLADLSQIDWELRPDQVDSLAVWFKEQWSQRVEYLLEKTETQSKLAVSQESENLERRSQQVDDVMTQRQAEWSKQLQDLTVQVTEFEGQHLRARNHSSTITR
jgi:hypothetical protein